MPIVGDVKKVLDEFILTYKDIKKTHDKSITSDWLKQIKDWADKDCMAFKDDGSQIKPQRVIQMLHKVTNGDAFVTSDVGQHQMWAAQYYAFDKPRAMDKFRWTRNNGSWVTLRNGLPISISRLSSSMCYW